MRKLAASTLLILLALAAAPALRAQERGIQLGGFVPLVSFGKGFDGRSFFVGTNEIMYVPELNRDGGWGVSAGYYFDWLVVEFYTLRTSHDSVILLPGLRKATHQANGLDLKLLLLPGMFRPYLQVGGELSEVSADLTAYKTTAPLMYGTTTYSGFALVGGAGIQVTPFRWLALYAGGEYRYGVYAKAKSAVFGTTYKIEDMKSAGFGARLGVLFRLPL